MNHPLKNGTTTDAYLPPAMGTPRAGADAHKRYASLPAASVAMQRPAPAAVPAPVLVEQAPAPVLPALAADATHDAVGYLPKPGSVAYRVCLLFQSYRQLRQTESFLASEFRVKKVSLPNLLDRSVDAGLLVRKRIGVEVYYGAGPHIYRVPRPPDASTCLGDVQPIISNPEDKEPAMAITKQIPANPAKVAKRKFQDEDYATPYTAPALVVPPPEPPVLPALPKAWQAAPGETLDPVVDCAPAVQTAPPRALITKIGTIWIDRDVPIPSRISNGSQHGVAMQQLVYDLQPGESAEQPINMRHLISKEVTKAHKEGIGKYTTRKSEDKKTVRVWRKE